MQYNLCSKTHFIGKVIYFQQIDAIFVILYLVVITPLCIIHFSRVWSVTTFYNLLLTASEYIFRSPIYVALHNFIKLWKFLLQNAMCTQINFFKISIEIVIENST